LSALYPQKRYWPQPPSSGTGPLNWDWDRIGQIRGVNQPIPKTIHNLNNIALQISAIQDQIDLLAVVSQQNKRGLDLFTAEKGEVCLFLEEDCFFFTNKSDMVRDRVKNGRGLLFLYQ
jgi:hypothetical protein